MIEEFQAETPSVGIFWLVKGGDSSPFLLAIGCSLNEAEPYGEFLTFGPGHYEIWTDWRRRGSTRACIQALVNQHEYEEWPRGRIVYEAPVRRFIIYCDKKMMTPDTLSEIRKRFALPDEGTAVKGDYHYQSAKSL